MLEGCKCSALCCCAFLCLCCCILRESVCVFLLRVCFSHESSFQKRKQEKTAPAHILLPWFRGRHIIVFGYLYNLKKKNCPENLYRRIFFYVLFSYTSCKKYVCTVLASSYFLKKYPNSLLFPCFSVL